MTHDDDALLAAWRAAIAATDAALECYKRGRGYDTVLWDKYEGMRRGECTAGRRYLAARDRAVAARVTCSEQGPGVADFAGRD